MSTSSPSCTIDFPFGGLSTPRLPKNRHSWRGSPLLLTHHCHKQHLFFDRMKRWPCIRTMVRKDSLTVYSIFWLCPSPSFIPRAISPRVLRTYSIHTRTPSAKCNDIHSIVAGVSAGNSVLARFWAKILLSIAQSAAGIQQIRVLILPARIVLTWLQSWLLSHSRLFPPERFSSTEYGP